MNASIYDNMLGYALERIERIGEDDIRHMMKEGRYPLSKDWNLYLEMKLLDGGLRGYVFYLSSNKNNSYRSLFRKYLTFDSDDIRFYQPSYYLEKIKDLSRLVLQTLRKDFSWLLRSGYKELRIGDFERTFGDNGRFRILWQLDGIHIVPRWNSGSVIYGFFLLRDGVLNTEKGFMTVESLATMNPALKRFILEGVDDDRV